MIIRIVRLTIQPSKVEEFKSYFSDSYSKISSFEGCTFLALYHDVDFPNILITYSKWKSVESLENYRVSELFISTWKKVKPLFSDAPSAFSMEEEDI